ncbi:MAG: RNA polymerase sigma factor [Gemmatimonadales bacterium]|jgi:RNA polymerase sigma-70 factor (ECF subfamily)
MTPVSAQAGETGQAGHGGIVAPDRLEGWIDGYGPELRRHLSRMLRSEADADDLLQDVWVRAMRKPPDSGPGTNVRAWLYRVATNAALDRLAMDGRRCCALAGRRLEVAPDPASDPDAVLGSLSPAARLRVREKVATLPPKQREAVWLRWVEGRDYEAIAVRLDCSKASARANVYNGMKRLRVELLDVWNEENGR